MDKITELQNRIEALENKFDNRIHVITYNPDVITEGEAIDNYKQENKIDKFYYPPICIKVLNNERIRNRT